MIRLPVELKILDPRLREWGFPQYGSDMSAGLDLYACPERDVYLVPGGKPFLIAAGFAIHIGDPGWCAMIYPRSGFGHKVGVVMSNGTGVIDADYQGQVMVASWARPNGEDRNILIKPGDRIAQMVFHRITRPAFVEVAEFSGATERGAGGFGSTGTDMMLSARRGVKPSGYQHSPQPSTLPDDAETAEPG